MNLRGLMSMLQEGPAIVCGVLWCGFGISKLVNLGAIAGSTEWAAQFGVGTMMLVSIVEIVLAILIFTGRGAHALKAGLVLLMGIGVMIAVFPPHATQSCGCAGSKMLDAVGGFEMIARVFCFAAMHLLALAVLPRTVHAQGAPSEAMITPGAS